jgi:gliding motility-associated-like protein
VVNDPPTAQIGGSSSGTVTMLAGGSVQLDPAVTGNDLVYTWSGLTPPSSTSYLSSTTVRNPVVTPLTEEPQLLYQLTITGRGGCTMVTPLTVAVNIIPAPHIPNAFSPNFDGIHDRWEIPYLNTFPNCIVEVYNRWGQQVYRSVGYNSPWDGRFKGEHLPIGTYYYIIDPKNGKNKMTGSLTILR